MSGRAATILRLVGLAVLLLASVAVAVSIGPAHISVADVVRSIAAHLQLGSSGVPRLTDAIVWELRLPRVLTAVAVGAGLGLSGAVMQSVTRNPLADPYLLGLSSGASLGAVAVLVLGLTTVALPLAAFIGALAALAASLALARSGGTITPTRAVLAGLAIAQLCGAGTSFVIFWSATSDSYREILSWLLGSLGGTTWRSVTIAGLGLLIAGSVLLASGRRLDAFTFGDDSAASLGIDVPRTRRWLLVAVALLTGSAVAVSGAIGFIGLVLPHAVRAITGPMHSRVLPTTALVGGIALLWADTAARTVFAPRELPVGVITALVGVPFFIVLMRRKGGTWT
jgi:iron complex transport system permease protein